MPRVCKNFITPCPGPYGNRPWDRFCNECHYRESDDRSARSGSDCRRHDRRTGPFAATGCPGIVTATVTGNVVNFVGVGAGVCVVVVTGPNGVTATIGTTV